MSQQLDRVNTNLQLAWANCEPCISQPAKNILKMKDMLIPGGTVHTNVVQKTCGMVIQGPPQLFLNDFLECE